MFKTLLWFIYFASAVGMFSIFLAVVHQVSKRIKESDCYVPRNHSFGMKMSARIILVIACAIPVINTANLFFMFLHFDEIVEKALDTIPKKS